MVYYTSLREKALEVRPEPDPNKPEVWTVGILIEEDDQGRPSTNDLTPESFLWAKVKPTTKLSSVYNAIKANATGDAYESGLGVFGPGGLVSDLSTPMQNLGPVDGLIVLHAAPAVQVKEELNSSLNLLQSTPQAPPLPQPAPQPAPLLEIKNPPVAPVAKQEKALFSHLPPPPLLEPPVLATWPAEYPTIPVASAHHIQLPSISSEPTLPPVSPVAAPPDGLSTPPMAKQSLQTVTQRPARLGNSVEHMVILTEMFKDAKINIMEKGIAQGVKVLDRISAALSLQGGTDTSRAWLQRIASLRKLAQYQKTIVGVVGNTGSGKSSLINALLDEERLVPTNCMRACTAVVTEISYNDKDDKPYRAEIEFITRQDWEKELNVLFQDLQDAGESAYRRLNPESEAGVAWAKIQSVYPKMTNAEIANSSPGILLRDGMVNAILGTTRNFAETDSLRFYHKLQKYVDSKEKTGDPKKDKNSRSLEFEYWPLIQVVKLYVKSPILATGAVIVDLPGVSDSNAARSAVAESYMKKCTGLWVVAPITRAVDDKSAKHLMGEGFRRQMLMDGTYCSLSFICSKSDDILVDEASISLKGLGEELQRDYEEVDHLEYERRAKKRKLKAAEQERKDLADTQDELEEDLTAWEDLQDQANDGKAVYDPQLAKKREKRKEKKRKLEQKSRGSTKRMRRSKSVDSIDNFIADDDEDDYSSSAEKSDSDESIAVDDEDAPDRVQLTLKDINNKLAELRAEKKEKRAKRNRLIDSIREIRGTIKNLDEKSTKINDRIAVKCVAERNRYSTEQIRLDFAMGIEEIDLEAREEREGDNMDPSKQERDYDEVAKSLPVFCVSSRGYQKLKGRFKKDRDATVFKDPELTGMPRLQEHCKKMSEQGRLASGRKFLTELSQLCNSLALWSSDDESAPVMTKDNQQDEQRILSKRFDHLNTALSADVERTVKDLDDDLKHDIFDRCAEAGKSAALLAPGISEKWGHKVSRYGGAQGGYHWGTYKAIVRRNGGPFTNGSGTHDMNAQLAEPVIKAITTPWDRCFGRRCPHLLKEFANRTVEKIYQLHRDITVFANPSRAVHLNIIEAHLQVHADIVCSATNETLGVINELQKEASREIGPTICETMLMAYQTCAAQSGTGCFIRMKSVMADHVNNVNFALYNNCTQKIKLQLRELLRTADDRLQEITRMIYQRLTADYLQIFGGQMTDHSGSQGRAERAIKERLRLELQRYNDRFKAASQGKEYVEVSREKVEHRETTVRRDAKTRPAHRDARVADAGSDQDSTSNEYFSTVDDEDEDEYDYGNSSDGG